MYMISTHVYAHVGPCFYGLASQVTLTSSFWWWMRGFLRVLSRVPSIGNMTAIGLEQGFRGLNRSQNQCFEIA